ncbi:MULTISPECIES: nucleoside recognition domain-containing protein [unclassified Colwellia]|uniref:nucleoside recognition domain-containing protein n=1 Tax=unclassified Colwellia TaxID=196834 RepID=UPI0015F64F7D|nr:MULTISPECIES: spore maturation protein [unclassified Colwellia]MBA6224975.1 spore maturation protein [Colwellia sp. MB3u-45]MBA6268737.1 spore maturation protein [Colwellia sp. MB3u-43]MBA6290256.1 spore maturation protein [Colwellia sp. MB3u-4]MBA6296335.1 spore maturation protein [Colwellia sp. MB02u-9]MBA6321168.1 spore maturation protein [Colwellia sp. MB02u-19]
MLNRIWSGFFFVAFISAIVQWLVFDQILIFEEIVNAIFDMSKVTVEIAIGLIGILSFWLGMMKIAEHAGIIDKIAQFISPLFVRLMPEVPKGHPAIGSMTMNLSANFLGLDNAATPLGLKAMQDLQLLNPNKETASDAQILFLVLNTSAVTLFPVTVFVYRAQQGALNPTDVFVPILLATFASTLAGLFAVAFVQKIKLYQQVILLYLAAGIALVGGVVVYFTTLSAELLAQQSSLMGNLLIFSTLISFLFVALKRKVNVYDSFIEGAKQGFETSIKIIPYLLAMLCAIGVFRASGALDILIEGIRQLVLLFNGDTRFVDALPTAFMKPLSGSGARAMMIETMNTHGADSFAGRLASIVQGSTETTFYVLAVYFGSVGIRYSRHALACGLIADLAGITAAIGVCYWFFG